MSSGVSTIILTQNNKGSSNNEYTYIFPHPVDMSQYELALSKINIYYSWFSISRKLNNNSYKIVVPNGAGWTTLTNTIPDGCYSISDLNNQLQYFLIQNKLYFINNTDGSYLYYFNISTNSTTYGVSLTCNLFPTSTPTGYSAPPGNFGSTLPLSTTTGQFVIQNNKFTDIIGFIASNYPSTAQATLQTSNSSYTPQVSPISSVLLTADAVYNELGSNTNVIHCFTTAGKSFGNMIESESNELAWYPCIGYKNSITCRLIDNFYQPLENLDSNLVIMLFLRKKIIDSNQTN